MWPMSREGGVHFATLSIHEKPSIRYHFQTLSLWNLEKGNAETKRTARPS